MASVVQVYRPRFKFANYLKKAQADNDKVLFSAWADGMVSTQKCIEQWVINNRAEDDIDIYKISALEFEGWLNFLGYYRKMYY